MARAFQVLTEIEVIEINRRMIERFGGLFLNGSQNLLNPGSLQHLVATIQGSFLEDDPYPTLFEKVALHPWRIITGHIFIDGNKRTGMEACRLMLDLNRYTMRVDNDVVIMALRIANREIEFPVLVEWIRARTTPHIAA